MFISNPTDEQFRLADEKGGLEDKRCKYEKARDGKNTSMVFALATALLVIGGGITLDAQDGNLNKGFPVVRAGGAISAVPGLLAAVYAVRQKTAKKSLADLEPQFEESLASAYGKAVVNDPNTQWAMAESVDDDGNKITFPIPVSHGQPTPT